MKKLINIFSLLIMTLLMLSSINAVKFYNSFDNYDDISDAYGDINVDTSSFFNYVATDLTFPILEGANYNLETGQLYTLTNTNSVPVNFEFAVAQKVSGTNTTNLFTKQFNLSSFETATFWVEPSEDLEWLQTFSICTGDVAGNWSAGQITTCGSGYTLGYEMLVEEKGTFGSVTNTFVGAMSDLIQINIGFWKIIYYLFIFSVIIGGLGLLINFAFKIYDWGGKVGDKKKEIFSGGHSKSRRD